LDHYGDASIRFILHTFPLPYHQWSFFANQGAHVAAAMSPTLPPAQAAYAWQRTVFENQDAFGNAATMNMSQADVIAAFAKLAPASVGVSAADFSAGIANATLNEDTRVSWKYGCYRSVSGTPTVMLNGIATQAGPEWTFDDWIQFLDPYISGQA
jgi:hypothetical protein